MEPSQDDLAASYAGLPEAQLLDLARGYDGLIESAQATLRAEFEKRHLDPPLMEEMEEDRATALVTIRRYRDLSEAIVARSLLESASIPVYLADENLVRIDWQISNMIGGIRLQVDVADKAAADELLLQPIPEEIAFSEAAPASYVQPHCPNCGSTDVFFRGAYHGVARVAFQTILPIAILVFPFTLALQAIDRWKNPPFTWRCNRCDVRWQVMPDENPPPNPNFGA
jgi:hypothetical protein